MLFLSHAFMPPRKHHYGRGTEHQGGQMTLSVGVPWPSSSELAYGHKKEGKRQTDPQSRAPT